MPLTRILLWNTGRLIVHKGEAPLRDFWRKQFIIMDDKLSEEFDHFRKHAIDAYLYPVEAIELLEYWFKSSGISIKTICKYDKTYLQMSSANIDTFRSGQH